MGQFDTIRPYNDSEVPAVLDRLFSDKAKLFICSPHSCEVVKTRFFHALLKT